MADRPHPLLLAAIAAQNSPYKVRGNIPLELKPDGEANEVFLVRGSVPLELRPDGSNIIGPFPVRGEIPISLNPQGIAGSTPINISGSVPIPSITPRGRIGVDGSDPSPSDLYSLPTTTNLALWVNAQTDVTLTGSDVTQWDDQSSSARNITPNSSEPIVLPEAYNGLNAIEQVATGGQWNFPIISASNSWTVFLVYDKTQTGQFFLKGSSNSFYFEIQNSIMRYAGGANVNGSLTPTSSSGLGVYEWVVNAGAVTLLQNGNVRGTGTAATAFAIDRAMAPISFTNSQGAVTDLIIYTSALSSGDRTTIRNTLLSRYGL